MTEGENVKVMGWGSVLMETTKCLEYFTNPLPVDPNLIFCASGEKSGNCRDDIGGPVIVEDNGQPFLVGITGDSGDCEPNDVPLVYLKLTEDLEFLYEHINAESEESAAVQSSEDGSTDDDDTPPQDDSGSDQPPPDDSTAVDDPQEG